MSTGMRQEMDGLGVDNEAEELNEQEIEDGAPAYDEVCIACAL